MEAYIQEFKRIAKQKKITLKLLAESIGMTEVGFHQSLKNGSIRFDMILKICEILGISPIELFRPKEVDMVSENMEEYKTESEREMLKEILKTVKNIEKQTDKLK